MIFKMNRANSITHQLIPPKTFAKFNSILSLALLSLCFCFSSGIWGQDSSGINQQVEISATIYEFRLESEKQLGIFYEYDYESGTVRDSEIFLPGTESERGQHLPALDLSGSFAKLDYGSIDFNIKTAIQEGRAMVINNPTVLVADGERASLNSGEEVPLTTIKTIAGNQTKLDLEYRKTGIRINVQPRILPGNNILLDLGIESSEIIRLEVFDRGDERRYELPVVSSRLVQTSVVIPSQKRLYIGGLYNHVSSDTTRKIPVLGDIPIVGFFLRGFNKNMTRTETVFQITPTIKVPGEGIKADSSLFHDLLESDYNYETTMDQTEVGESSDLIIPATENAVFGENIQSSTNSVESIMEEEALDDEMRIREDSESQVEPTESEIVEEQEAEEKRSVRTRFRNRNYKSGQNE